MTTRRDMLIAAGAAGLAGRAPRAAPVAAMPQGHRTVVLFQGDSITDCGRERDNQNLADPGTLGTGYPLLVAARMLAERPERGYVFLNRGISGNRVPDLQERWQRDALDLAPDLVSILIGVNDLWHKLMGRTTGTVADYESGYDALLAQTRAALPSARLVIMEPFVLRTGAVDARFFPEFDERRAAAARVAQRAGARFLPLQAMFDDLTRRAPPAFWLRDGVHPTAAGHFAIARRWLDAVHA